MWGFSIEAVGRALAGAGTVTSVEVVERFTGCVNEVARLAVRFSDSTRARLVIGKLATGIGRAAGRRERAFFERVVPAWDSGAPALLGACELGATDGVAPRLLLVTEDLGALGYRVRGTAVSPAVLAGAIEAVLFWQLRARAHARWMLVYRRYGQRRIGADDARPSSSVHGRAGAARGLPRIEPGA
jgi:hypothetical protein